MQIEHAVLLGVVEGLTEFFPISSTGHLVVVQHLLGISETSLFFNTVIQLGAICAVVLYYRTYLWGLLKNLGQPETQRYFLLLGIASIPLLLGGFLLKDVIQVLQQSTTIVGLATLSLAPFMIYFSHRHTSPKAKSAFANPTIKNGVWVGICQMLSLIPGISRSGVTILGGLQAGWSFEQATRTAFLLGIPAIGSASAYELLKFAKSGAVVDPQLLLSTSIGFVIAFFIALATIHFTLPILRKYGFLPFAFYRIILGLCILLFLT